LGRDKRIILMGKLSFAGCRGQAQNLPPERRPQKAKSFLMRKRIKGMVKMV
jgi:hypothetical protein